MGTGMCYSREDLTLCLRLGGQKLNWSRLLFSTEPEYMPQLDDLSISIGMYGWLYESYPFGSSALKYCHFYKPYIVRRHLITRP